MVMTLHCVEKFTGQEYFCKALYMKKMSMKKTKEHISFSSFQLVTIYLEQHVTSFFSPDGTQENI